jgi:hypothetical protein
MPQDPFQGALQNILLIRWKGALLEMQHLYQPFAPDGMRGKIGIIAGRRVRASQ